MYQSGGSRVTDDEEALQAFIDGQLLEDPDDPSWWRSEVAFHWRAKPGWLNWYATTGYKAAKLSAIRAGPKMPAHP